MKTISKGEIIFYEKDPVPAFFITVSGRVIKFHLRVKNRF